MPYNSAKYEFLFDLSGENTERAFDRFRHRNVFRYVVEYQNGENQKGTKQSDAVKTHIAMTKNHAAIIKQLTDLVPPEKKKESKLQALRDE